MQVRRIFGGLTVITVGLILLANTTGYLPWSVWWNILSLWPLLLVAAGIDIIGRSSNQVWLQVLSSVLIIAGLAYGALVMPALGQSGFVIGTTASSRPYSLARPHDSSIENASAAISGGLSRFRLDGGSELVTVEGVSPLGPPTLDVFKSGSSAKVSVSQRSRGPFMFTPSVDSRMNVTLDRSLVWDAVEVSAGLSDSTIDLSELEVTRSNISAGLSSTSVTYGAKARDARTSVSGGLGSLRLRFPRDLAVELEARTGLGSLNTPAGWTKVSGSGGESVWQSPGYASATGSKLRADVSAGLGSVAIEQY